MAPIKQGKYEFKKESLSNIHKRLGITQRKMAELLGVPPNTLSRWEIGPIVPDANSLAAIYSLAKDHGITPEFFGIRGNIKQFQYNLIVLWDFQTLGVPAYWVQLANNAIMDEIKKRFTGMTPLFKAFIHRTQEQSGRELENLGWRVWAGENEIHDDILNQAKGDAGQHPEGTALLLISLDNNFVGLIDELLGQGVQVFVMSTQTFNNKLFAKVGEGFAIPWYPVSLEQPKRAINNLPASGLLPYI